MNDDQMVDLRLSRRDVGRLLALARAKRHKAQSGVSRFAGENWDEDKGRNMLGSLSAYTALERALKEAMNNEEDHPRRAGRNPA